MPVPVTSAGATTSAAQTSSSPQGHSHGDSTATTKLQGTWQDRSDLAQKPGTPTKSNPYSTGGPAFTVDGITGKSTTIFAPYIFNGIGPGLGKGDGRKYSGTLNGAKISYYNGRVNFYVDSNKNNKLDAKDAFKGQLSVDAYEGAPDLTGKSGTWLLDSTNKLYIHDPAGALLIALTAPKGVF